MASELIYILDDDDDVRLSLSALLESLRFRVESFSRADDFLVALQSRAPNCVLLDLRMPGVNGLELLAILRQRQIKVPVLIITGHGDVSEAVESMKLGAVDVLQKPFSQAILLKAIAQAFHAGEVNAAAGQEDSETNVFPLSPPSIHNAEDTRERLESLSPREREILDQIIAGRSSREIADLLGISPATVNNHRTQIKA
jgi:FixJ family two-component response regulator